ncbi:aspartyl/asparaginyl beta-hydroxylase domain-containing protein [Komarekiella sp. 'clone 1']|uniref:Aspartyl/asparaginyl beta-hydroxylase domain-containing protein n=1 Tax=Komarekiella delphini-convector SJRDD-AB1 TaxID=2593771 RepID=A0AA40T418_9NOST|nr:aspartyl/asparaginyl beta-hydroxylase domain-containing protein [Komarekiella delphini-convector]MBD6620285.1 aspartyl/asparaginyl beta-hydroxylase domain-containing protein [Komarekiella delphini-convector SJRDD-AB1]
MVELKTEKLPSSISLGMSFDIARIQEELKIVNSFSWIPEEPFSLKDLWGSSPTVFHDGKWKGLSLKSQGGRWDKSDPGGPGLEPFEETAILKHTPYFKEIIDSLKCHKRSIRLSLLPAGASIQEHCDTYHDFKYGQIRLHIPLVTHEDVVIVIDGDRCKWEAGQLWYGNFAKPHWVMNNSSLDRIHLIIDVCINDFVLSLFPEDFVCKVRANGIIKHQEPIDLTEEELKKFECKFIIPAGLMKGIFETDDGIPGAFDASIRLLNGQIVFFVEERPLISLVPISPTRFCFNGWTCERHLEFEIFNDSVCNLQLVMRSGYYNTTINLALLS